MLPLERGTDSCLLLLFTAHRASAWTEFFSLPRLIKHFLHPLVFPSVLVWIFFPHLHLPYLCQVAYGRGSPQVSIATRYRRLHIGAPSPSQLNTRVGAGRPRIVTHGQTLTASQWCHVFPKHGTALLRIQKTLKVPQPYHCPLKTV